MAGVVCQARSGEAGRGGGVVTVNIGVIFTSYAMADMLDMSLAPWLAARRAGLGGHTFKIAAVSGPFTGFPHDPSVPEDGTAARLKALCEGDNDWMNRVFVHTEPMPETEARGRALQWLVEEGVDLIWQWDGDESLTGADIANILVTVQDNPWIAWFRVSYRNLVFDTKHALAEPFTPARIHRVRPHGYCAVGFWDDNNVLYGDLFFSEGVQRDINMASMTIPVRIAAPLHYTWLNNDRSRRKIFYQVSRGWECSYRWDDEVGLCFNEQYFTSRGEPLPEVIAL
jgi:hypothetical protein